MRLGLHVVNFSFPGGAAAIGPTLARTAAAAEEAGIANLSVMDHYLQLAFVGDAAEPMIEGYTTLGYLAGLTREIELQLLVTGVTYRHPALLAKIVSTLDVLSGGRSALGLGAAWYQREHAAMGVAFPPVKERFERLEETLQIVLQMFSDDDGPYNGTHYQLAETINSPAPITRPHPPIMIGGMGEQKTLLLVAKYANATNMFAGGQYTPEVIKGKLDTLRQHCEDVGRDYDDITKTIIYNELHPDPEGALAFREAIAPYADLGITAVHVSPRHGDPVGFARAIGENVVPRLNLL